MMKGVGLILVLAAVATADPTTYFREQFEDESWSERWVQSQSKSDYGKFEWTAGSFYGDADLDKGLQTTQNAKFYAMSSSFDSFSNRDTTFVVQFTVKHEQKIDCGGGYVKIFPSTLDQEEMNGESPYNIMFGPDICGPGTKKVHVIFNYKGNSQLVKKDIRCKDDAFTHLYTLIVKSDNTYVVKIDNKKVESGSLEDDWDFLPPKTIPDPEASQPEDWDDRPKIDDPEASKPEDWDKPEYIPDPDAKMPDDWDEDTDGEWEPPMIPNPDYKGEWRPTQMENPDYQGLWEHPQIANPEYEADDELYLYEDFGVLGLDLWQVKPGTIFDNFLITDDEDFAEEVGNDTWGETKEPEKQMKEAQDEEERKKQEELAKEMADQEGDEDFGDEFMDDEDMFDLDGLMDDDDIIDEDDITEEYDDIIDEEDDITEEDDDITEEGDGEDDDASSKDEL